MYSKNMCLDRAGIETFAELTHDPNPIHRGDGAVILGTQMDLLIKQFADNVDSGRDSGRRCTEIKTRFKDAARAGEQLNIFLDEESSTGDTHKYRVWIEGAGHIIISPEKSYLVYSSGAEQAQATSQEGLEYLLGEEDVTQANRVGLKNEQPDVPAFAIALMSSAIIAGMSPEVKKEIDSGKRPFYLEHHIILYDALYGLKVGDKLVVKMTEDSLRKGMYASTIEAFTSNQKVYRAVTKIMLV